LAAIHKIETNFGRAKGFSDLSVVGGFSDADHDDHIHIGFDLGGD
jgi:hypothetical protein